MPYRSGVKFEYEGGQGPLPTATNAGYPTGPVQVIGKADSKESGTQTTFKYDTEIFNRGAGLPFRYLVQRFARWLFVTRGVTIYFQDERSDREMTFYLKAASLPLCVI